jgi:hypothetical protein
MEGVAGEGDCRMSRARHVAIRFARDLTQDPPAEWRNELDQTLFPGGYFKEFIFFHRESKSLIVTDAIINIELDKMDEPWRTFTRLSGMYYPHGQVFFGMRLPLLLQQEKAAATVARLHAWRPLRVLLCHGRCFDVDGDQVVRRILG